MKVLILIFSLLFISLLLLVNFGNGEYSEENRVVKINKKKYHNDYIYDLCVSVCSKSKTKKRSKEECESLCKYRRNHLETNINKNNY